MTYMLVILSIAVIGFGAFYLVQDKEQFYLEETVKYVLAGKEFEIDAVWVNKKRGSDYEVISTDPSVVTYRIENEGKENEKYVFTALSGGIASITYRTSNENYRNVACQVFVGDGSSFSPFYIGTPEDLLAIGNTTIPNNPFTLNKSYKLIKEIDLKNVNETGYFIPIAIGDSAGFNGNFDGNGYPIKNIKLNPEHYGTFTGTSNNIGFFHTIGSNGRVANLKLDNVSIQAVSAGYVGAVTAVNYGTVERVDVKNAQIAVTNAVSTGGAVGLNISTQEGSVASSDYTRKTARIDRVSVSALIGASLTLNETTNLNEYLVTGIGGNVGGLVGENQAGIVIYSYAKGDVHLNLDTQNYGGIVGLNSFVDFQETGNNRYSRVMGANVKDTYTLTKPYIQLALTEGVVNANIGGLIGYNNDTVITVSKPDTRMNRIIGNYYSIDNLNAPEHGVEPKTFFKGIGAYKKDNVVSDLFDADYFVSGKTNDELNQQATYVSHVKTELIFVDNVQTTKETIVTWKFGTVWNMSPTLNDGFPYLNFANIELTDDIYTVSDSKTIHNLNDLLSMTLDGHYILVADIDLGEEAAGTNEWNPWEPIGTKVSPFTGSFSAATYINTSTGKTGYYTLFNLTVVAEQAKQSVYGGLFGAVSGKNSGYISNLVLENPSVTGFEYAGAVAGTNGFSSVSLSGQPENEIGMSISNVFVKGGTITGSKFVGGIVGNNFGVLKGNVVQDSYDATTGLSKSSATITLTPILSGAYVGGITGYNQTDGNISRSTVKDGTKVLVTGETAFTVHVGGIAGYNASVITQSVSKASSIQGAVIMPGAFGGIAGTNTGIISNSYVNTSVAAGTTDISIFVGGVAGQLISKGKIENVQVYKSAIDGTNVGGIVGLLHYVGGANNEYLTYTFGKDNRIVNTNFISISNVAVEEAAINGAMAGGLVGIAKNGIVSDAYVIATISGVDENSVKAGIVADLPYVKAGNNITAGVFQNVYTVATFTGNGSNHAVSKSEFLLTPFIQNIPATDIEFNRPAGFVVNYVFNDSTDGNAAKPQRSNWFENVAIWFSKLLPFVQDLPESASSTGNMQKLSYYSDFNFNTNSTDGIWISGGKDKYITLRSLVGLEESITKVTLTFRATLAEFTIESSVEQQPIMQFNAAEQVFMATLKASVGDSFTIRITPNEGITFASVVVTYNGEVVNPNLDGNYFIYHLVENGDISISYTKA